MTHVIINHVGGFPAPQLHCCNLPFPLFRLWGSLSFMVSCWKRFYSSANDLAIMEKVLFWAADLQVFWQSETTGCLLVPGKQWLLVAILSFSVSGLQDSCGAPAVTMGSLRVRTLVLLWEIDESLDGLRRCLLCLEDGGSRWKFRRKNFISITRICSYIKGAWELNLCGKNKSNYFLVKKYRAMLVAKMEFVRQECVCAWRLMNSIHLKKIQSWKLSEAQVPKLWGMTSYQHSSVLSYWTIILTLCLPKRFCP